MKAAKRRHPKRRHPEADLHRAVARYLDLALPRNHVSNTFPAGGGGKIRGAQLKAMGLKPGWPDIIILGGPKPIWLELKSKNGRLSAAQIEAHTALREAGCIVEVVRSVDDVIKLWKIL